MHKNVKTPNIVPKIHKFGRVYKNFTFSSLFSTGFGLSNFFYATLKEKYKTERREHKKTKSKLKKEKKFTKRLEDALESMKLAINQINDLRSESTHSNPPPNCQVHFPMKSSPHVNSAFTSNQSTSKSSDEGSETIVEQVNSMTKSLSIDRFHNP